MVSLEILDQESLETKLKIVEKLFSNKSVVVAFSGGVDSTVVAFLAKTYAREAYLVMQRGSSVPMEEEENAIKQANQLGIPLKFITYDETDLSKEYTANPENRCYYCKNLLYGFIDQIRQSNNYDIIASGTNITDLKGHRPGYQAALERNVINPLVEAGISKSEVRMIARMNGLLTAEKPATACLASRVMTGVTINKDRLDRIAKSERFIRNNFQFKVVRVRDHGLGMARIEIGSDELYRIDGEIIKSIAKALRSYGFTIITLDMEGYRPSLPQVK